MLEFLQTIGDHRYDKDILHKFNEFDAAEISAGFPFTTMQVVRSRGGIQGPDAAQEPAEQRREAGV